MNLPGNGAMNLPGDGAMNLSGDGALYVGLMSGTSVDAIDSALVRCDDARVALVATHQHAIPDATRERIALLSHSGADEIERMGRLDRELGLLFGEAVQSLLALAGVTARDVAAIGSHGQTIRHQPGSATGDPRQSFTLQIADPNTIAETTGITTVADFRRRDVAAGGEGAPLAPAFHAAAFAAAGVARAIVNIGGIANVTVLAGGELERGFDTGPGNTLLDLWHRRHRGGDFDPGGDWAAGGEVVAALLEDLRGHPYFSRSGPRSTGKEGFNLPWLDGVLLRHRGLAARDVQATLAEFTASSISRAIRDEAPGVDEIYLCGGGAHNAHLVARLAELLSPASVASTASLGIDPDWVEAAAFAWLARQRLEGRAAFATAITGAAGPRVLGAVYPP